MIRGGSATTALTRWDGLAALLLLVACLSWTAIGVSQGPELSRYDEWTYIDYSHKIAEGHVPVRGETLGLQAREAWSCRGMEGTIRKVRPPSCARVDSSPVAAWPYSGENYNGFHPPLYFLLAGFGGKAIAALTGADFVTGARWVSGMLVAAGILALYFAIRRWRVGPLASFGAALLTLSTPAIAAAAVVVHNDAVTPLAGAASVWLLGRVFVDRAMGWALPAAMMLVIAFTRVMSTVGLVTVTLMFAVALLLPRVGGLAPSHRLPLAKIIAGQAGALLLGYFTWTLWQNARTPDGYSPAIAGFSTDPYTGQPAGEILRTFVDPYGLTDPITDWYLQPSLESHWTSVWSSALYWGYLVLPLAVVVVGARFGAGRMLLGSIALGPAVTGAVVQVRELATSHSFFRVLSGRYAMALVPLYAAGAALVCDRRIARWILLGFASLGYAAIVTGPFVS